jgi:hypothetical protein
MEGKRMNGMNGYSDTSTMKVAECPRETIINMLMELKGNAQENRQLSYIIKDKMFNPAPCNEGKGEVDRPETVETLLDKIRTIIREANNTLCTINDRL